MSERKDVEEFPIDWESYAITLASGLKVTIYPTRKTWMICKGLWLKMIRRMRKNMTKENELLEI